MLDGPCESLGSFFAVDLLKKKFPEDKINEEIQKHRMLVEERNKRKSLLQETRKKTAQKSEEAKKEETKTEKNPNKTEE